MTKTDFIDLYEVLETSPNASFETVERVFRYLAKRFHPDVAEHGDMQRFSQIVEAYQVLRDPVTRAAYDVAYEQFQSSQNELLKEAQTTTSDCEDRHLLLSLFYGQRRRNMKQPGVGIATLEKALNKPTEVIEFHLWYFREKGWIMREESGLLAITSEGVDQIEARELMLAQTGNKRIELKKGSALPGPVRSSPESPVRA